MIPAQFDYVRPANLDEVLRILKDREGEAKILSGGYSLIPLIKLRLAQPALLVDIQDIDGMDGIVETDDELRIGARATHRQIHENAIVADHYPMLEDATAPDRRSAGPQLGHDRRLGRPRGPGLGLAGHPDRRRRLGRLPERERRARRQGARLLPRHVHDGHRADRGPDRGPHPAARPPHRRRVREARAQGRRLRHGRRRPPGSPSGPTARIEKAGIGVTGVADTPFAATDAEALLVGKAPERRPLPAGGRGRGGAEQPRWRRPRSRRLQAGDGRRADPQGAPHRRRPRERVRVGGQRPR